MYSSSIRDQFNKVFVASYVVFSCKMGQRDDCCIVQISVWETVRIHFLSCLVGVWVVFKRFFKWLWDPNQLYMLQLRDNPPSCLVDSSLGQHKYVKLKVSFSDFAIEKQVT